MQTKLSTIVVRKFIGLNFLQIIRLYKPQAVVLQIGKFPEFCKSATKNHCGFHHFSWETYFLATLSTYCTLVHLEKNQFTEKVWTVCTQSLNHTIQVHFQIPLYFAVYVCNEYKECFKEIKKFLYTFTVQDLVKCIFVHMVC